MPGSTSGSLSGPRSRLRLGSWIPPQPFRRRWLDGCTMPRARSGRWSTAVRRRSSSSWSRTPAMTHSPGGSLPPSSSSTRLHPRSPAPPRGPCSLHGQPFRRWTESLAGLASTSCASAWLRVSTCCPSPYRGASTTSPVVREPTVAGTCSMACRRRPDPTRPEPRIQPPNDDCRCKQRQFQRGTSAEWIRPSSVVMTALEPLGGAP